MEKQFKLNGKRFYPIKKLAIGLTLLGVFYFLYNITGGANGLADVRISMEKSMAPSIGKSLASIISNLFNIVIGLFMVYCFVSGFYRTFTFGVYNPVFEDKTSGGVTVRGCDSYPNINRVLSYRESKLASMSPERAVEFYVGCSKIESLYTGFNNGPETMRTLSFLESKLSGMSSDRALNFLANKIS